MNVDADAAAPDAIVSSPELLQALRHTEALVGSMPPEVIQVWHQQEIDAALNSWLGEDLTSMRRQGAALWDGDHTRVNVREAGIDEAAQWHASRNEAVRAGEQDAGNEDWLVFLVEATP